MKIKCQSEQKSKMKQYDEPIMEKIDKNYERSTGGWFTMQPDYLERWLQNIVTYEEFCTYVTFNWTKQMYMVHSLKQH